MKMKTLHCVVGRFKLVWQTSLLDIGDVGDMGVPQDLCSHLQVESQCVTSPLSLDTLRSSHISEDFTNLQKNATVDRIHPKYMDLCQNS